MPAPSIQLSVLTWYFPDPLKIQVFCDSTVTDIRVSKHIVNYPNSFCLGFFNVKLIILQVIAIWSKASVPSTLTCFFPASIHGLLKDVLTFYLRHGR